MATGGTPTYLGTGPIPGLTAGTHTYTITDGNNCTASASITLTEPAALVVSTSQTNVACNGGNNGSATASVSGGTAPYTYSWSNSANTSAISSLSAGTYSLTVTDVNGCSNNLASVTITEPTALALTTSSTPASCNPDGSASVSVTGGIGTYTYLWSNGATTASLANLAAGSYAVTVTDGNGCSNRCQRVYRFYHPYGK
ncbi:MAG: hypothetical protein EBX02_12800 [Betaproteobacteria bacterium]|nr:hypothetical protein [Betaproteobacteria bacterium]